MRGDGRVFKRGNRWWAHHNIKGLQILPVGPFLFLSVFCPLSRTIPAYFLIGNGV